MKNRNKNNCLQQQYLIKLSLKHSLISQSNTCIAEPNLEVLPLTKYSKGPV